MFKHATFSPCRTWRYALYRRWDRDKPWCMFVGLNPSTADETEDDPTVRRCIGFAEREGCGGLIMCNAYAFRATKPKNLWLADDPVGPDNNDALLLCARHASRVIVAWGVHAKPERVARTTTLLQEGVADKLTSVFCLGRTKDGCPKHPLYLAKTTPLEVYA